VGTIRQLAGAAAKEEIVDWDEMAKLVTTPAGKRELMNLRSTIQDLMQKATVPVRARPVVSRGVSGTLSPPSLNPPAALHFSSTVPCRNCLGRVVILAVLDKQQARQAAHSRRCAIAAKVYTLVASAHPHPRTKLRRPSRTSPRVVVRSAAPHMAVRQGSQGGGFRTMCLRRDVRAPRSVDALGLGGTENRAHRLGDV
jgi:hypothetical protein